jgi:hypothetical protein
MPRNKERWALDEVYGLIPIYNYIRRRIRDGQTPRLCRLFLDSGSIHSLEEYAVVPVFNTEETAEYYCNNSETPNDLTLVKRATENVLLNQNLPHNNLVFDFDPKKGGNQEVTAIRMFDVRYFEV